MKTINLKPRSLILINPSEEKAPEIKLKNSNTKRKLTEKQLDALAKGRQKRTQNLKNNKNKKIIANIAKKHNSLVKKSPKQKKKYIFPPGITMDHLKPIDRDRFNKVKIISNNFNQKWSELDKISQIEIMYFENEYNITFPEYDKQRK